MGTLYVNSITTSTSGSTLHVTNDIEARGSLNVVGAITAGSGTFTGIKADLLDVKIINNAVTTVNTLEVQDKKIIVGESLPSSEAADAGIQIGGTDSSDSVASILYDHGNTGIDFNIGGTTELLLTADGFEGKPGADLGAVTGTHGTFGQLTGSSLKITGEATIASLGAVTGTTLRVANLTSGRATFATTNGQLTDSAYFTFSASSGFGTIDGRSQAVLGAVTGTHGTFGQITGSSLKITGDATVAGSLTCAKGALSGTTLRLGNLTSGRIAYATTNGQLTDDADLTFDGTTLTIKDLAGKPAALLGAVTGTHATFGFITGSSLKLTGSGLIGALTGSTLRLTNLTSGRVTHATSNGQLTDSAYFTFSEGSGFGQIGGHATRMGAFLGAVTGTHGTFGQITGSSIRLTGSVAITGKPAVQLGAVTGTHGTFGQITGSSLKITGDATVAGSLACAKGALSGTTLRAANLASSPAQTRITYANSNGQLIDSSYLRFNPDVNFHGKLGGNPHLEAAQITGSSLNLTRSFAEVTIGDGQPGSVIFTGSLACAKGALSGTTLRVANLTSGRATFATTNGQLTDSAYLTFSEGSGFGTLGGKPAADLGAVSGTHGTFGQLTGSSLRLNDGKFINFGTDNDATLGYNADYSNLVLDAKAGTFWVLASGETAEKPEIFVSNSHTNGSSGGHFVFSKTRGWGGAADRAVIANDILGTFSFRGADGSGGSDTFATIKAVSTDITNNYGEVQMSTSSGSHGPGLDGVSPKTHIARINGEVVTTILIDIGAGGIISSNAAGDVIGADGAAGSYLTRVTTAVNGVVYRGELACVEVPTTGDADINLTANAAVLAEDAAGEGEHVLVNGGTWTLGAKVDLTIPSGGIVNDYLYLTHGGSTAGTYNAGKYIIKLYGADF